MGFHLSSEGFLFFFFIPLRTSLDQAVESIGKLEEENKRLQAKLDEFASLPFFSSSHTLVNNNQEYHLPSLNHSRKERKPSVGVLSLDELQKENEVLNAQLSLVLKHLGRFPFPVWS